MIPDDEAPADSRVKHHLSRNPTIPNDLERLRRDRLLTLRRRSVAARRRGRPGVGGRNGRGEGDEGAGERDQHGRERHDDDGVGIGVGGVRWGGGCVGAVVWLFVERVVFGCGFSRSVDWLSD